MIRLEEAFDLMMGAARPLPTERVDIGNALYRILAEDVCSDMDMPPFDKSAMDGYACRRADLDGELTVLETIQAGQAPSKPVGAGQCSKIMTGAPVPEGADCVIMIEYTECPTENTVRFTGKETRANICIRGEDIQTGDCVLRKGSRIEPQHIAVLATVGCVNPLVACKAKVGVIATGDELVEPECKPAPSQIRTSNSYQLCAQVAAAGGIPRYYGIVSDTEAALDKTLKDAMAENDVVLLSGGVSMGDFDLVPGVMRQNGVDILFDAIAVKPGKPTTFGVAPTAYCVGLPGNPVSTFVQFEILVKPFLLKLMGHEYRVPRFSAPLARKLSRKRADRDAWLPVSMTDAGEVEPRDYHGSAHVNALCGADGLILIPADVTTLDKGTQVDVRPF